MRDQPGARSHSAQLDYCSVLFRVTLESKADGSCSDRLGRAPYRSIYLRFRGWPASSHSDAFAVPGDRCLLC